MRRSHMPRGFTLVELLVVIGIIGLLISILLPGLSAARRQAGQTKCAAQMKQLANAYLLYSIDNKGWYPPARLSITAPATYSLGDYTFPFTGLGGNTAQPCWYDFISKYVTKTSIGYTASGQLGADYGRRSVIWSCPAFEPYVGSGAQPDGVYNNQIGVGPNIRPTMSENNPTVASEDLSGSTSATSEATWYPPPSQSPLVTMLGNGTLDTVNGGFVRQTTWGKRGAERCLFGDSRFWILEARPGKADGTFPGQPVPRNVSTYTDANQTLFDWYRHGKYPGLGTIANTLAPTGGKVAFNILYADGHVGQETDKRASYTAIRLRFPN